MLLADSTDDRSPPDNRPATATITSCLCSGFFSPLLNAVCRSCCGSYDPKCRILSQIKFKHVLS